MHPINWVSACYAAMRGGIQVHYMPNAAYSTHINGMKLNRIFGLITANDDKTIGELNAGPTYTDTPQVANSKMHSIRYAPGTGAAVLTNGSACPVLSGEMTDQHQYLFNVTRQEYWLRGSSVDDSDDIIYQLEVNYGVLGNSQKVAQFDKYMNISPDFNLHFFVCTPTVYYSPDLGQAAV